MGIFSPSLLVAMLGAVQVSAHDGHKHPGGVPPCGCENFRDGLTVDDVGKDACAKHETHGLNGGRTWCQPPSRPMVPHFDDGCPDDLYRCTVSVASLSPTDFPQCQCNQIALGTKWRDPDGLCEKKTAHGPSICHAKEYKGESKLGGSEDYGCPQDMTRCAFIPPSPPPPSAPPPFCNPLVSTFENQYTAGGYYFMFHGNVPVTGQLTRVIPDFYAVELTPGGVDYGETWASDLSMLIFTGPTLTGTFRLQLGGFTNFGALQYATWAEGYNMRIGPDNPITTPIDINPPIDCDATPCYVSIGNGFLRNGNMDESGWTGSLTYESLEECGYDRPWSSTNPKKRVHATQMSATDDAKMRLAAWHALGRHGRPPMKSS